MSTFGDLDVGARFRSRARVLDEPTVRDIIERGGYTHPLFADPEYAARSVFGRTPVPGQGLLLIMGGLAEQTGRFDETTVALLGFDEVRFRRPAFAGDEVVLDVEVIGKEPRGILVMRWRCLDADQEVLVDAVARMLFRLD